MPNLLGDKFAPKVSSSMTNFVNPSAAGINDYAAQDFSLAGQDKKLAELNNKLSSSGQAVDFQTAVVGQNPVADQMRETNLASANQYPQSDAGEDNTSTLKVKITQNPKVGDSPNELVFKVMPRIEESGGAEYDPIVPLQHPGAIQKFRNSTPRTWTITGRLISRTMDEATENLAIMNMIRAWRMPFYGEGTNQSMSNYLGAPPPILTLTAYGPKMIGPAKCVLTNYGWGFPNDVDYVQTEQGNPFPVILDISLSLTESWSPAEFSGFDIVKYKQGDLSDDGAFKSTSTPVPKTQSAVGVDASEANVEPPQAGVRGYQSFYSNGDGF